MKRLLSLSIIILAIFSIPNTARSETVELVADNWCPYNCEPSAANPGFIIEIAQRAFTKHGIQVKYTTIPWSRAIEETRAGSHDAIVAASKADAPDFIFPAISQGQMRNAFYVKKGSSWRYENMASLEKISFGAIADYSYSDELDRYITEHRKNMRRVQMVSGDNAFDTNEKKLFAGRIDAMIEAEAVMRYHINKHVGDNEKIQQAGILPPSSRDDLYIAFSPKHPKAKAYADIIAQEMTSLRKSGELKTILARYGLTDWQP